MATIRVYELAKEMEMNSKDLLDKMQELGLPMKNHMSTIPSKEVNRIKSMILNLMGDPSAKPIPIPVVKKEKPTLSGLRPAKTDFNREEELPSVDNEVKRPVSQDKLNQEARERQKGNVLSTAKPDQYAEKPEARPNQGMQAKSGIASQNREPRKNFNEQAQPKAVKDLPKQPGSVRDNRQKPDQKAKLSQTNTQKVGNMNNQNTRPLGLKNQEQKPQGQKPQYQKPQGQRPQGQKPQGQRPQGQRPQGQRPQGGAIKQTVIGKDNADKVAHLVKSHEHEEDNRFLNKLESTIGDRTYDRGGKTKTPNRKTNRFEDNRNANRGKAKGNKNQRLQPKEPAPVIVKNITLDGPTTVVELAHLMNRKAADLIKKLFNMGVMATINQELDMDTMILLGQEFGTTIEARITKEEILTQAEEPDAPELLKERPPVVTIMGHVDHGKTSLLDAIRKANVQASEAGGITQHIGAYQVVIDERKITFLDTPGHEAFTAMRARGAQVTDIAVLVVAADDGVMPQTIEAVNHAKAANVPIIVAVNKIDKEGANPDRIKQELTEYGLVPEDWGGDTIYVEVSAKTHQGIDQLLEMILLVAEVADLKANPNRKAKGVVIEAKLDKGRGPVATVLVQNGTLEAGDFVIVGMAQGRIRAMNDERGRSVKKAKPSMPVEIVGLSDVPQAGDIFQVVEDERLAKQIVSERTAVKREEAINARARISLDDLFQQIKTGEVKDLNIIIKADVQGSIEALKQSLEKLSNDEVRVNIIHQGVGGIRETDVDFASASNAIILGFNVRPDVNARKAAENQQVDIRLYRVIYNAIEDVKSALSGLLKPEIKEVVIGHAEVRQVIREVLKR